MIAGKQQIQEEEEEEDDHAYTHTKAYALEMIRLIMNVVIFCYYRGSNARDWLVGWPMMIR